MPHCHRWTWKLFFSVIAGVHLVCFAGVVNPVSAHPRPSAAEVRLRSTLSDYAGGDTLKAVGRLLAHSPEWAVRTLEATVTRVRDDIKHHRRAENRFGHRSDAELQERLRADLLHILLLFSGLQLEASAALRDVTSVGERLLGAERAFELVESLHEELDLPVRLPSSVEPVPCESKASPATRIVDWSALKERRRDWYVAASSRLQDMVEVKLGPALVERALRLHPDDADLLLARGSYIETGLALSVASVDSVDMRVEADKRLSALEKASLAYATAVRHAGHSSEASVRLGRVLLLQNRVAEARATLDRALAGDLPGDVRYWGLMFRARAFEIEGDLDAASVDYNSAFKQSPYAQSAMVALCALAGRRGDMKEAANWAEEALRRARPGGDPWHRYIRGQGRTLDAVISAYRRSLIG